MRNSKSLLSGEYFRSAYGRVGPPILMWMLGVPGGLCLLLWLFFFRGK